MSADHPVAARYLEQLRRQLGALAEPDRTEILREISDHVADATTAGRPLDATLLALGPAEALARAYAVELALNPRRQTLGTIDRALTIIGLLAVASLPSFIVLVVLGSIGVALMASGVGVFAGGVGALINPSWVPGLTVSPWLCLVVGPLLAAGGLAALAGLTYYIRTLVRVTLTTLERVRRP